MTDFPLVFPQLRRAIGAILLAACGVSVDCAQTRDREILISFLRDYLGRDGVIDRSTRYQLAFADLSRSRKMEVIAYITGQSWCGSGGCTTLILRREDSSFVVVSRIPITRPPIRVLNTVSNGWHDIGVWVQGGGIQPGYEAELPFDGKRYPTNPSSPPSRSSRRRVAGEIVILPTGDGKLLYPESLR